MARFSSRDGAGRFASQGTSRGGGSRRGRGRGRGRGSGGRGRGRGRGGRRRGAIRQFEPRIRLLPTEDYTQAQFYLILNSIEHTVNSQNKD